MTQLIKEAIIIHDGSKYHLTKKDILIENGKIVAIEDSIPSEGNEVIAGHRLYCSIGLFDIGTSTGDPGFEHRESMDTLTQSALAGGYTGLAVFPTNKPVTQSKSEIKYLKNHPDRNNVSIYPIGALSKDLKGEDIAEYWDMQHAGAVGFGDGLLSIQDTSLMSRALLYATQMDAVIIHHPTDKYLSYGGEMHEGEISTSLGLKGIPDIAESQMVQRDLSLMEYNRGKILEHAISAAKSVQLIKQAKETTGNIYASVAYLNLLLSDHDLSDFDSNLKVNPALRCPSDRTKLISGVKDGTIDIIISNHVPLDDEQKNVEFPYALSGASGLETCLAACLTELSDVLDTQVIIHKMTIVPRMMLNIPIPLIEVGQKADLCIFDINCPWIFEKIERKSKSANYPWQGKEFTTKVVRTII
ncbi:MAG: dihydroorotase, partial [Saprospiraceae bacterium]